MATVLVLGFEPYGGHAVNPSERLVGALAGRRIAGHAVRGAVLPVRLDALHGRVEALLAEHRPAAAIGFGLRPGERAICLERVAANRNDFPIADNAGARERGPVCAGEPERRAATLPIDAIRAALLEAGIPVRRSDDAGRFLCNALMYALLSRAARLAPAPPAGFVHLPCLPEQVAAGRAPARDDGQGGAAGDGESGVAGSAPEASMPFERVLEAAGIALRTTLAALAQRASSGCA